MQRENEKKAVEQKAAELARIRRIKEIGFMHDPRL